MHTTTIAAAVIAGILLIYLFLSLIKPEWFE